MISRPRGRVTRTSSARALFGIGDVFQRIQAHNEIEAPVVERQTLDIRHEGWGPLVQQLCGEWDRLRREVSGRQVGPQVNEVLRESTEAAADFKDLEPTDGAEMLLRKLVPRRRRRGLTCFPQLEVPGVVCSARVDGHHLARCSRVRSQNALGQPSRPLCRMKLPTATDPLQLLHMSVLTFSATWTPQLIGPSALVPSIDPVRAG